MNVYEIFTERYSRIIDSYDLQGAIEHFDRDNPNNDLIIAIVCKNHPIAKEFGIA